MIGLLSLPLRCVSSRSASTAGASLSWAPAVLGLLLAGGCAKVVSARLNLSHGTIDVGGVCNFLGSVSSQQKFEVTDVKALGQNISQLSDRLCHSSQTDQCYSSVLQLNFI